MTFRHADIKHYRHVTHPVALVSNKLINMPEKHDLNLIQNQQLHVSAFYQDIIRQYISMEMYKFTSIYAELLNCELSYLLQLFLGAFEKSRNKKSISFVASFPLSVCLSVCVSFRPSAHMEQFDSNWTYFHDI